MFHVSFRKTASVYLNAVCEFNLWHRYIEDSQNIALQHERGLITSISERKTFFRRLIDTINPSHQPVQTIECRENSQWQDICLRKKQGRISGLGEESFIKMLFLLFGQA